MRMVPVGPETGWKPILHWAVALLWGLCLFFVEQKRMLALPRRRTPNAERQTLTLLRAGKSG